MNLQLDANSLFLVAVVAVCASFPAGCSSTMSHAFRPGVQPVEDRIQQIEQWLDGKDGANLLNAKQEIANKSEAPQWIAKSSWVEGTGDSQVYYGVGVFPMLKNMKLALGSADNRARGELAKLIQVEQQRKATEAGTELETESSVTISNNFIVDWYISPTDFPMRSAFPDASNPSARRVYSLVAHFPAGPPASRPVLLSTCVAQRGETLREEKHSSGGIKERCLIKLSPNGVIGEWTSWDENGKKKREATFKDGQPDGVWTQWYENGKKSGETVYKDGEREGLETTWFRNGEKEGECAYKDDKREGMCTAWYMDGKIESTVPYENGRKEGVKTTWSASGKINGEGTYRNGKLNGVASNWYDNGTKKTEVTFKEGKREGRATIFYESGQIKSEFTFRDDKLEGRWTDWYENGQQKEEGNYMGGAKDGEWLTWDETGNTYMEYHFRNGDQVDGGNVRTDYGKFQNGGYGGIKWGTSAATVERVLGHGHPVKKVAGVGNRAIGMWGDAERSGALLHECFFRAAGLNEAEVDWTNRYVSGVLGKKPTPDATQIYRVDDTTSYLLVEGVFSGVRIRNLGKTAGHARVRLSHRYGEARQYNMKTYLGPARSSHMGCDTWESPTVVAIDFCPWPEMDPEIARQSCDDQEGCKFCDTLVFDPRVLGLVKAWASATIRNESSGRGDNPGSLKKKPNAARDRGDIVMRSDKVALHRTGEKWVEDSDGVSGWMIDKLDYCRKFWPATTDVKYTGPYFSKPGSGPLGDTTSGESYKCMQGL